LSIIQLYFYIVPQEEKQVRVGLDIGSTTIKCAVLDEHDALIYSTYERHYSIFWKRRRSCCAASMQSTCTETRLC